MKELDFVVNGAAQGDVASVMLNSGWNPNVLRPWRGNDGRSYITVHERDSSTGKVVPKAYPITNTNATMRKDDWLHLDRAVVAAAQPRLNLVQDLRKAGLTYNLPNGMGKTVLQTERQSDINPADVSMEPTRESQRDRPEYDLVNLPLPIIHKDFSFSARQIEVSRNSSTPLDTTMAELAGRKVAEIAEQMAIGSYETVKFAGGYVYGLTNFPQRQTYELADPTDTSWTPEDFVTDVLAMKRLLQASYYFGPYRLYVAADWDQYLDADYSAQKGDNTLRERVAKINQINGIVSLDYLTGFQAVLVQMTADVVREVIGMDITTIQWPTMGGLMLNFKVMGILVPQLRAEITGKCGIIHGDVP